MVEFQIRTKLNQQSDLVDDHIQVHKEVLFYITIDN